MPEDQPDESSPPLLKILAVVVLYKRRPRNSLAFNSLLASISDLRHTETAVSILLYDNAPGSYDLGDLPDNVRYEAAAKNQGIAGAYNHALQLAISEGFTWLLTLDQDTTLPLDFLSRFSELARRFNGDNKVAAIVPQLFDKGRLLSPLKIHSWGSRLWPAGFTELSKKETHAYNSASLFRVSALQMLGGFNRHFWLDFLDMWVYHHLYCNGKCIYVAGNVRVEHEISLLDSENAISVERASNILYAQCAFVDLYQGRLKRLLLTLSLFGRIYRQRKRKNNPSMYRLTLKCLAERLFHTKKRRIEDWIKKTENLLN